jgi:hypothetical protein
MSEGDRFLVALETVPDDLILICGRGPSGRLPDGLAEKFGSPGSRPHGVELLGPGLGGTAERAGLGGE